MNKHFNKFSAGQKGFTIIELIVVIAIIAVLAAIVLVSVTSYINKGKDAAIKGNMDTILKTGVVIYDRDGNYSSLLPSILSVKLAIDKIGSGFQIPPIGSPNSSSYCACYDLLPYSKNSYCVDYNGYKKESGNPGGCPVRCATRVNGSALEASCIN